MLKSDWLALWTLSADVCGTGDMRAVKRRLVFMLEASKVREELQVFLHPTQGSPLQRTMQQRPETIGVVVWPYVCANWSSAERLRRLAGHFEVIQTALTVLDLSTDDKLVLADLRDVSEDLHVVLDRPAWFMREGQMVLNLFIGEMRIYSLVFSLAGENDRTIAHVGAIQGVVADGIQADYKDLTKALHGMRPRDFLVELFRIFCRCAGVLEILAVADASRQHRSRYFGNVKADKLTLNYDEIWSERGGVQAAPDFFVLRTETPMKNLEEVASKKRAMYRRRYELLAAIEQRMRQTLADHAAARKVPPATGLAGDTMAA